MIPGWWPALVLAFGVFRILRLVGWDDFPPVYRARAWVLGERWVPHVAQPGADVSLPGKTPTSEVAEVRPAYDRPTLAHLLHCPFCLGWWISLAVYVSWRFEPGWTVTALAPFALSGAVGLIAKNWDP